MVGSRDYGSPSGQINIVTRRRHPGSALKPFVYGAAIEQGHAPASIAYDVRDISVEYRDPGPERGPVAYREARDACENHAWRSAMSPIAGRSGCTEIPVVVHVVYRTAAENISDAQVQSQIDVLNEDFRMRNSDVGTVPAAF